MRNPKKIALVTGSGNRLGRKTAIALAEHGFDIVAHYRTSSKGILQTEKNVLAAGRRCVVIRADLSRSSDVKKMFSKAHKSFGRLDLLVNNAAIFPRPKEFVHITESEWDLVMNTNLKSVFLCCREAVRLMKNRGGQIINVASLGAFLSWKNHLHYNVSKAAVVSLTRSLARVLAPRIRVNGVAPGTISVPNEETASRLFPDVQKIPLKRYGTPNDITQAIIYLASSDYLTGEILKVDGGVTLK